MSELNPLYKEVRICKKCGKEFRNKFKDYELCYDCLKPVHEEISKKVNINMLYKTKINYYKYDTRKILNNDTRKNRKK